MAIIFDKSFVDRDLALIAAMMNIPEPMVQGYIAVARLVTGEYMFTTNGCCEHHGAKQAMQVAQRTMEHFTPCSCDCC